MRTRTTKTATWVTWAATWRWTTPSTRTTADDGRPGSWSHPPDSAAAPLRGSCRRVRRGRGHRRRPGASPRGAAGTGGSQGNGGRGSGCGFRHRAIPRGSSGRHLDSSADAGDPRRARPARRHRPRRFAEAHAAPHRRRGAAHARRTSACRLGARARTRAGQLDGDVRVRPGVRAPRIHPGDAGTILAATPSGVRDRPPRGFVERRRPAAAGRGRRPVHGGPRLAHAAEGHPQLRERAVDAARVPARSGLGGPGHDDAEPVRAGRRHRQPGTADARLRAARLDPGWGLRGRDRHGRAAHPHGPRQVGQARP